MDKKVIAVIGCGRIALNAHFPAFAQMENIRVKYACDIIPEKAEKMKGTGVTRGYMKKDNEISAAFKKGLRR